MLQFIATNWTVILFGLFFVLMLRMHGGGGGCGMGHDGHQHSSEPEQQRPTDTANSGETDAENNQVPAKAHSGGCH